MFDGGGGGFSTSRPQKTFMEAGFKSWKHATGKDGILKGHDNRYTRKSAVVACTEIGDKPHQLLIRWEETGKDMLQETGII